VARLGYQGERGERHREGERQQKGASRWQTGDNPG
jgi:hypothetical protein